MSFLELNTRVTLGISFCPSRTSGFTTRFAVFGVRWLELLAMAVFVYQSCEVALLRIGWFATLVSWTRAVRDWSLAMIRPARQLLYEIGQRGPNLVMRRIGATITVAASMKVEAS